MARGAGRLVRHGSSMGLINTISVLQARVVQHELAGYSESTVGWIFSIHAFIVYFAGVQVGMLRCRPRSS